MTRRFFSWWRRMWRQRLGMLSDPFRAALTDVDLRIDELLIVQKRCSALMPTPYGKDTK